MAGLQSVPTFTVVFFSFFSAGVAPLSTGLSQGPLPTIVTQSLMTGKPRGRKYKVNPQGPHSFKGSKPTLFPYTCLSAINNIVLL